MTCVVMRYPIHPCFFSKFRILVQSQTSNHLCTRIIFVVLVQNTLAIFFAPQYNDSMTNKPPKPRNNPLNIATDLVSGVLVGLVGGFYLDKWLGLTPLFTIIFLIIGMAAGFRMVWKEMKK